LHGLRICPDLDSVMYTLGDVADDERGWGRKDESWRIKDELAHYGAEPSWFGLGDLDIATHLVRTRMLDAGYSLTDLTAALCERWQPGVRLLPMTDDRCETHVVVDQDGTRHAIHFQEWWIKHRAALPAQAFVQVGVEQAECDRLQLEDCLPKDAGLLCAGHALPSSAASAIPAASLEAEEAFGSTELVVIATAFRMPLAYLSAFASASR